MKEKGIIKVSLSVVICIFVIVALLILCGGLYYFGFVDKKQASISANTVPKQTTQNITVANKITNEIMNDVKENKVEEPAPVAKTNGAVKIDESKDWVYGEERQYGSVPHVNIDSSAAKVINEEIEREYNSMASSINNGMDGASYKYTVHTNDNYISLITEKDNGMDFIMYGVYNLDTTTGKFVSNSELISYRGLSINNYIEKLKEAVDAKYSQYESRVTESSSSRLARHVKDSNISINTPLFLGEDGKIDVVINLETFVGKGDYNFIIDVE